MTKSNGAIIVFLILGALIRCILFYYPNIHTILSSRPELTTPTSSFRRLSESIFLFEHGHSPYEGDIFHQPPLVFALFYPLFQTPKEYFYIQSCGIFILVDLLIALGLARLCRNIHLQEEGIVPMEKNEEIWLNKIPLSPLFSPKNHAVTVVAIYLLNPYSVCSCVAKSTVSLTHLAVVYSLLFASQGAVISSMITIAIGTYLSVYPFFLLVPIYLILSKSYDPEKSKTRCWKDLIIHTMIVFVWLGLLLFLSKSLSGGWKFIDETYLWIARYPDLTPNVGIFWYFFMEVFDRFIPYFLFVLHVHPLIYIIPISFRLSHRPQAFAVALVGILTLFQAYPTLGDFGLFLSLFSMHPKTFMMIKNGFAYALGIAVATCLFPVMWFLWLYAASGNANFFYNQTLVYQIFHSQMITSFVGAAMKRDKQLQLFRKHFHAISSPSPTNSTKTVSSNSSNSSTTSTTINSSAIQRAEQTISKAKVE